MARGHWLEINRSFTGVKELFHTASEMARKMYFYIQGAGYFMCQREFHLKRKEFRSILVKLTLNGSGLLRYRGRQYEYTKNQLMIIDCYDFQEYHTYKNDLWEFKWIHFNGGMSNEYFNYIFENYGPIINMPEDNRIGEYIDQIIHMMENGDPQLETKATGLIYRIFTDILLAVSAEANPVKNMEYNNYIQSARKYMEDHYQEHIDVEDMAKVVGLSPSHFSALFKRYTGFAPHEYLVKYRINHAKALLSSTCLSIGEVAAESGFSDPRSFIRAFKKHEETTPLKFRKNSSRHNLIKA